MDINIKEILEKGKDYWNSWCEKWIKENPERALSLSDLDLSNMDLSEYDLSGLTAQNTNFSNCKLISTDFTQSDLEESIFTSSNISYALFDNTRLIDAKMNNVIGIGSDFYQATLENADLSNSDFRNSQFGLSRLISTKLDGSNLTDAILWGTQRTLWSITKIKCKRCYWGELEEHPPSAYNQGEFELLHKYNTTVKLHFQNGIKPLEFFSLSHLVHGIEKEFNNCKVRISSLAEVGKGSEVIIEVESVNDDDSPKLKETLNSLPYYMRNDKDYILFLKGLNQGLETSFLNLSKQISNNNSLLEAINMEAKGDVTISVKQDSSKTNFSNIKSQEGNINIDVQHD